ncbi:MAG: ABC transporter ATP-binding protein [Phycisphaeraceae bacterium]|nr:ABC transporter ATP-binding protein [Phycisphaeraceae bacterium]
MSQYVIEIDNLSKRYLLGRLRDPQVNMGEALVSAGRRALGRLRRLGRASPDRLDESFWALHDVSFAVERGQVLGVIGRNGAGKSTLLKILSRITEPTRGKVTLRGRVGSLLEVGTGFHPELSGRENIFLNGAILGMRRREIAAKFDQIVDFAEVGRFLDTPVKRYSSGMYVRLAFAVAAHLEPEVLIVDEVLAVGDAGFQKKCLGKMSEVAGEGRTVLLVSHQMAAIQSLCHRVVMLDGGRVTYAGDTAEGVGRYLRSLRPQNGSQNLLSHTVRQGDGRITIRSMQLRDTEGHTIDHAICGQKLVLAIGYRVRGGSAVSRVVPSFAIRDSRGVSLILHRSNFTGQRFDDLTGEGEFTCVIPRLPLTAGQYEVGLNIEVDGRVSDNLVAGGLSVEDGDFFGTGCGGHPGHSPVLVEGDWACQPLRAA